ncbi:MAG: PIN domain-containing protein [Methanomassiliicoccaceae archaeon]|nr:PIN domain-containing protein [Methanomassiliicoccaceae archaeon]
MNVLFDTNVLLDMIEKREPFYAAARRAAEFAVDERITGFVSVQSLNDIFYFVSKVHEAGDAFDAVEALSVLFKPIGVLPEDSMAALMSDFRDYEDGIINASAVRSGIDIILTRDGSGFIESELLVVSPDDLERYLEPGAASGSAVTG